MLLPHATWARLLAVGLVLGCLLSAAWLGAHWWRTEGVVPVHTFQLQSDRINEWTRFGGSWEIADGEVKSNSYQRGAKLLAGSKYWSNYTISTDIWFEGPATETGIVIRTNDESEGVDSYNGYFVGLRSLDGTLVVGRANYSWIEVLPVTLPGGIHSRTWYRLRTTAFGCNIAASVTNLVTQQTVWIAFEEHFCVKSGRFGLRTFNAKAKWRNISVEPATWTDYHELAQHAASVEHPIIVNGPPWWTPWHVGMLFLGVLTAALLIQRFYFRFKTWKTNTINRERERMAHEIHDTMAQGFAGIGYQIQGIRTSIIRAESFDSRSIVDQLNVAYQLVHRCHEEASRTIAILGSSSPSIQNDLLGELAETARIAARNRIETIAELRGNPVPLNLRLANALLHIGQQAVANAVGHGNPSVLKITLSYEGSGVELVVEDNGRGFENTPITAGFGILGMQKRARDVEGVLNILSTPGHGTRVSVTARLQHEKRLKRILARVTQRFQGIPADSNVR